MRERKVKFKEIVVGDEILWFDVSFKESYRTKPRGYTYFGRVESRTDDTLTCRIVEGKGPNHDWTGPFTGPHVGEIRTVTPMQFSHFVGRRKVDA